MKPEIRLLKLENQINRGQIEKLHYLITELKKENFKLKEMIKHKSYKDKIK